ncbi:MAG: peptidylprolyl isomerase, partial [Pseudomonadota bacterium]
MAAQPRRGLLTMQVSLPLRAATIALALCLGTPGNAQETEDKVIATIGGKPVYQSELTFAETDLDPQFSRLPADQRTAAALSAL